MSIFENKKHSKYLNLLVQMASTYDPVFRTRFAAAIVLKNEIVAFGVNKMKTHPFAAKFGKNDDAIYWHAEADAIKNALREISSENLSKATLYVARVKYGANKKMIQALARPCLGCQRCIASFDIKNVVYTCDEGYDIL